MTVVSGEALDTAPPEVTAACRRVSRALSKVGQLTGNCAVVFAQEDLACPLLSGMGWRSVETASTFQSVPTAGDVDVVLIVSHGDTFDGVRQILGLTNRQFAARTAPMVMVVLIGVTLLSDVNDTDPAAQARAKVEFACTMADARGAFFEGGADEVLGLLPDEYLEPNRLIECIQRSDHICSQLKEVLNNDLVNSEERSQRLLHTAQQKLLAMLPGRILENLPMIHNDLPETHDAQGELLSVGEYAVQKKLGQGTFGAVHLVNCPKRGPCAMKVIPKRSLKKLSTLISLDHETAFMLFAAHHPNIVRAHDAIHGPQHFYLVMEYAGELNVHKYTKKMLEGGVGLLVDKVRSFCAQEANAVGHLHGHMIVHRDIKPENWIVSDDGTTLKLADFGLAMQLSGPGHLLKQCCGSLPFCPPEVFTCKLQPGAWGYDGQAADVWSLAVGFVEQVCGPFAVERLLNWLPAHPTDQVVLLSGLRAIPELWKQHADHDRTGVGEVIPWMLALNPAERCKINQVQKHPVLVEVANGAANTNAARFQLRPLTAGYSQSFFGKPNTTVRHGGIMDSRPLSVRLGGGDTLAALLNRSFENFSRTAGFAEHLAPYMNILHGLCTLLCQEHLSLFDSVETSPDNRRLRQQIVAASRGLPLVERHLVNLRRHFRTALRELQQVDEHTTNEAVNRLQSFGDEMKHYGNQAMIRAGRINSPQWRARVLDMATARQVSGYVEHLRTAFAISFVLGHTSLRLRTNNDIHSEWMAFLGSDRLGMLPIVLPPDATLPTEHLAVVSVARDALKCSGWSEDVVDTVHYLLLQSWRDVQDMSTAG